MHSLPHNTRVKSFVPFYLCLACSVLQTGLARETQKEAAQVHRNATATAAAAAYDMAQLSDLFSDLANNIENTDAVALVSDLAAKSAESSLKLKEGIADLQNFDALNFQIAQATVRVSILRSGMARVRQALPAEPDPQVKDKLKLLDVTLIAASEWLTNWQTRKCEK